MATVLTVNGVETNGYDFPSCKKGSTFIGQSFQITINSNKDITGAVITLDVEGNIFSTTNGKIIITDASNGKFQIVKQLIEIPARNYKYFISIAFANGDIKEYIKGHWNITE